MSSLTGNDGSAYAIYGRRGTAVLDAALERFNRGLIISGMDHLVLELRKLRDEAPESWRIFTRDICRSHPIAAQLREDPFTRRSFLKPRGYTGDPEMLDFIFASDKVPTHVGALGASVFSYTTTGPAPRSVRARAAMIARTIDDMAPRRPLRVLAVMSGHLWEAGLSQAMMEGGVEKYVAFDQDARTLAAIDARGYGPAITTYQGALRPLFRGKSVFRNFDIVYSPLCDNLPDAMASHFIGALLNAVAPGGRLIVSNFAPELVDAGYMEAFMDWNLLYRNEWEMMELAANLPPEQIAERRSYRDPHGNIAFLEITKG